VTVESVATATQDLFERIPGVFQPGQRVVERPRAELQHRVSINSLGYRGPEMDVENRSGRVRLMCLGDSFTYGSYVDDDQTLPAHLERMLREHGYPVDVINAGVGGTTIVDQLYVLRKAARIDVHIVLLVFSENDISDLARDEPVFITLEKNRRLKGTPGVREIYSLVRNTALFNLGLEVRGWYQGRRSHEAAHHVEGGRDADGVAGLWSRYDMLFGEMQTYLAARNVAFVFVIFPSHYRIDARSRGDDRIERVEALAHGHGVRTINLLAPLRAAGHGASDLYLLPYDGHPSGRGYAVAARAIAPELEPAVREAADRGRHRVVSR
jgi:lysophospholipase L1-like esterase